MLIYGFISCGMGVVGISSSLGKVGENIIRDRIFIRLINVRKCGKRI